MVGGAENCYLSHIEILSEITGRVDNIGLCGGTIFLFKLLKTTGVSETLSMYVPMYDWLEIRKNGTLCRILPVSKKQTIKIAWI